MERDRQTEKKMVRDSGREKEREREREGQRKSEGERVRE